MKQRIYADNAATTKLDSTAFDEMRPYLLENYGNPSQPYGFAKEPQKALKTARERIARCINADPDEIFFTSCGTESDNWVIKGVAFYLGKGYTTITSEFEHHAVLNSAAAIERFGYPVAYLRPDHSGVIKPTELDRIIANTTGLVSVMLANNEIGTIQPIKELAQIAHEHGTLFHTDAVQAVGHIEIDVKDLGVDFLSASAHKFNGPKGCGFLYIKKGTQINPLLDGGAQESEHRAGTENVASIVGMARALEDNCSCLHDNTERILEMEKALLSELTAAHVHFHRNGCEPRIPGNISLSLSGIEGEALLHRLDLRGICVSTGSACDSVNTQISHVLRAISLDEKLAKGTIRISLGKNNTAEEAGIIGKEIVKILNGR